MATAGSESGLHQLAPYIGKLKSSIAGALVDRYTSKGETILDPFAGAGTICLEAAIRGRKVFGADISPYARVLSIAKLTAPATESEAVAMVEALLSAATHRSRPDLRSIPGWVREFFHRKTLQHALQFAELARRPGNEFAFACFLGILHHQRPGFLSYPSSHLVPYLRNKTFPRSKYPSMYDYRELAPRLLAKVRRAYRRHRGPTTVPGVFKQSAISRLRPPQRFDAIITSPPYMNALDYVRDNRLRLWFIDQQLRTSLDKKLTRRRQAFAQAITHLARHAENGLRVGGRCVLVVGEETTRSFDAHPAHDVCFIFAEHAPSLRLQSILVDSIPDVRRSRRRYAAVKREQILVFRRR